MISDFIEALNSLLMASLAYFVRFKLQFLLIAIIGFFLGFKYYKLLRCWVFCVLLSVVSFSIAHGSDLEHMSFYVYTPARVLAVNVFLLSALSYSVG